VARRYPLLVQPRFLTSTSEIWHQLMVPLEAIRAGGS
jgi:hypothetical protein